jgi:hypothetical protein
MMLIVSKFLKKNFLKMKAEFSMKKSPMGNSRIVTVNGPTMAPSNLPIATEKDTRSGKTDRKTKESSRIASRMAIVE